MRLKLITILVGIIALVVGIMLTLNFTVEKPNNKKNGFIRKINKDALVKLSQMEFDESISEIIGGSGEYFYISSSKPDIIFEVDTTLKFKKKIKLDINSDAKLESNFSTILKYPEVFIMASNTPSVIRYNLKSKKKENYKIDKIYSHSALISPLSIVVKGFDTVHNDQILRKINLVTGDVKKGNITEIKHDGGLSTAGLINYDKRTNLISYVNFFSNRIYFADTNLNLIKRGKTIDTFNCYQAVAKESNVNGKVSFTYAVPPKVVNYYSCTYSGKLFVYSLLKSDNQSNHDFYRNANIDIYDLYSGSYKGSFYIPTIKGKMLISFKVQEDKLLALYEKTIVTYGIQGGIFN
jgi:hypothetical protein